jgi:hypothetical protein
VEGPHGEEEDEVQHVDASWAAEESSKQLSCLAQANTIPYIAPLAIHTCHSIPVTFIYAQVVDECNNDIGHTIKYDPYSQHINSGYRTILSYAGLSESLQPRKPL